MADGVEYGDVRVEVGDDYVATAEIRRPPNNFFDIGLIDSLCQAFEALDADPACRAIVLCSQGKHFCAGADFSRRDRGTTDGGDGGSHNLRKRGSHGDDGQSDQQLTHFQELRDRHRTAHKTPGTSNEQRESPANQQTRSPCATWPVS